VFRVYCIIHTVLCTIVIIIIIIRYLYVDNVCQPTTELNKNLQFFLVLMFNLKIKRNTLAYSYYIGIITYYLYKNHDNVIFNVFQNVYLPIPRWRVFITDCKKHLVD